MTNATAHELNAGKIFTKMGCNVVQLKSQFASAAEDARRAARKSWRAAEDVIDEVSIAVKKQPLKSIGITAGVALGIGGLAGWLGTRKYK